MRKYCARTWNLTHPLSSRELSEMMRSKHESNGITRTPPSIANHRINEILHPSIRVARQNRCVAPHQSCVGALGQNIDPIERSVHLNRGDQLRLVAFLREMIHHIVKFVATRHNVVATQVRGLSIVTSTINRTRQELIFQTNLRNQLPEPNHGSHKPI
jgi:hypothetical protein